MAVYHLACRLLVDPARPNPPARVAKYVSQCARPGCTENIHKGDMISCTRDNENGQRKEAGGPRVPDYREGSARVVVPAPLPDLPFPEGDDDAPATERAPMFSVPVSRAEYDAQVEMMMAAVRRENAMAERLADAEAKLADVTTSLRLLRETLASLAREE